MWCLATYCELQLNWSLKKKLKSIKPCTYDQPTVYTRTHPTMCADWIACASCITTSGFISFLAFTAYSKWVAIHSTHVPSLDFKVSALVLMEQWISSKQALSPDSFFLFSTLYLLYMIIVAFREACTFIMHNNQCIVVIPTAITFKIEETLDIKNLWSNNAFWLNNTPLASCWLPVSSSKVISECPLVYRDIYV